MEEEYEVTLLLPDGEEEITTVDGALDDCAASEMALEHYPEGTIVKAVVCLG